MPIDWREDAVKRGHERVVRTAMLLDDSELEDRKRALRVDDVEGSHEGVVRRVGRREASAHVLDLRNNALGQRNRMDFGLAVALQPLFAKDGTERSVLPACRFPKLRKPQVRR